MSELPDEHLDLSALRRGDATAFARLVERHQPVVLGLCQSLGLRGADRDDAAAEVFAAVFRSLPRFEGRSALGTWIYRIACRVIPKVRHRYRQTGEQAPDETQPDERQSTPLEKSMASEEARQVWQAVSQLDERSAMAVELHYRRGCGVDEIATIMECPAGTIKTLLFRARARLKEILQRQEISK